jgi:hypothetical protein
VQRNRRDAVAVQVAVVNSEIAVPIVVAGIVPGVQIAIIVAVENADIAIAVVVAVRRRGIPQAVEVAIERANVAVAVSAITAISLRCTKLPCCTPNIRYFTTMAPSGFRQGNRPDV